MKKENKTNPEQAERKLGLRFDDDHDLGPSLADAQLADDDIDAIDEGPEVQEDEKKHSLNGHEVEGLLHKAQLAAHKATRDIKKIADKNGIRMKTLNG